MKQFPIYTRYTADIFVKHISESRCIVVDLLETLQKIQVIDNGKMTSFHYDNLVMGKANESSEEEFKEKKDQVMKIVN